MNHDAARRLASEFARHATEEDPRLPDRRAIKICFLGQAPAVMLLFGRTLILASGSPDSGDTVRVDQINLANDGRRHPARRSPRPRASAPTG